MKKLLFGIAALGLLATASCKKDKDNGPSNRITIGGDALGVTGFATQGSLITVTGGGSASNAAGMIFHFSGSSTPAAGNYKIVENATGNNEVDLTVSRASAAMTLYSSTNTSTMLTVGKNGDKLTISMPEVQLKEDGGTATINVSAEAQQL